MDSQHVELIKQRMVAALAAEGVGVDAKAVIVREEQASAAPYLTVALVLPHANWASGDRIAREVASTLRKENPNMPEIHLRSFETPEEAALDQEVRDAMKMG
jgi:hypothetical protein